VLRGGYHHLINVEPPSPSRLRASQSPSRLKATSCGRAFFPFVKRRFFHRYPLLLDSSSTIVLQYCIAKYLYHSKSRLLKDPRERSLRRHLFTILFLSCLPQRHNLQLRSLPELACALTLLPAPSYTHPRLLRGICFCLARCVNLTPHAS
jgi:hypothetical protein